MSIYQNSLPQMLYIMLKWHMVDRSQCVSEAIRLATTAICALEARECRWHAACLKRSRVL